MAIPSLLRFFFFFSPLGASRSFSAAFLSDGFYILIYSGLLLDFAGRNLHSMEDLLYECSRPPDTFLGCQPDALIARLVASPAERAWNAHIVFLHLFVGCLLCLQIEEIDFDARDNLFFFVFGNNIAQSDAHSAMLRRLRSASHHLLRDLAGLDFSENLMKILTERWFLSRPPRVGDRS